MLTSCRKKLRTIATLAVLAVYGTGGVLGYGLHKLWHCEHCSSTAVCTTESAACTDCPCCAHECEAPQETDDATTIVASHEDCPICAFLAQAQSPAMQVEASIYYTDVVNIIPASEKIGPLYLPSDHLARGPPTVV